MKYAVFVDHGNHLTTVNKNSRIVTHLRSSATLEAIARSNRKRFTADPETPLITWQCANDSNSNTLGHYSRSIPAEYLVIDSV